MKEKAALLFLPEDIIFDILTWLPAQFLHNHGRFVCKTWSDIIKDPRFIKAHAFRSNGGLLFQYHSRETVALFAAVKDSEIEVSELDRIFAGKDIVSCSAGVVLLRTKSRKTLYVANPATYQILELPRLPSHYAGVSIAHMPTTGEIKVLCQNWGLKGLNPLVLTVGRNMAWSPIDAKPKPNVPLKFWLGCGRQILSLDGVVYYTAIDFKEGKLFAIDLSNESIHRVNLPRQDFSLFYRTVSTGKSLSLIYLPSSSPFNVAKTWKLKDFRKSEWVEGERLKIAENSSFHLSSQLGLLENADILFYCDKWPVGHHGCDGRRIEDDETTIVAYDWRAGKLVQSWKGGRPSYYNLLAHKQTLVSWYDPED